jgi:hypothetical protein
MSDDCCSPAPPPPQVPRELHPFVYRRSADGYETSLLLVLHSSGSDAHSSLRSLRAVVDGLPQTSVLAVTGPYPLAAALLGMGDDQSGSGVTGDSESNGNLKDAATWLPVVDTERREALPVPAFRRRDGQ